MATVLAVERWCPSCDKLFRATLTVEGHGKESTRIESPCPDCGDSDDPGDRTLNIELRPFAVIYVQRVSCCCRLARRPTSGPPGIGASTVISGNAAGGLTIQQVDRRIRSYLLGLGCDVG